MPILFSVIIPVVDQKQNIAPTLNSLWEQPSNLEIILVAASSLPLKLPETDIQIKTISGTATSRGALLNEGAAAAGGDVLLFLWPGNQVPVEALLTIERNLALLPQTVGGNFHVKFDNDTFLSKFVMRFIKQQRYLGGYLGNSGLFMRNNVFKGLDGFRPCNILEDYEFGQRLEACGPTLYLPDKMITSSGKFQPFQLKTAFMWMTVWLLLNLGVQLSRLNAIAEKFGAGP